mmetsp:Transcript_6567/g.14560  ORF Transcript_6567/g.14560 Transcript_6567/m.14560 type:complete len:83 (+) Transcript_6567:1057-1305(+)
MAGHVVSRGDDVPTATIYVSKFDGVGVGFADTGEGVDGHGLFVRGVAGAQFEACGDEELCGVVVGQFVDFIFIDVLLKNIYC